MPRISPYQGCAVRPFSRSCWSCTSSTAADQLRAIGADLLLDLLLPPGPASARQHLGPQRALRPPARTCRQEPRIVFMGTLLIFCERPDAVRGLLVSTCTSSCRYRDCPMPNSFSIMVFSSPAVSLSSSARWARTPSWSVTWNTSGSAEDAFPRAGRGSPGPRPSLSPCRPWRRPAARSPRWARRRCRVGRPPRGQVVDRHLHRPARRPDGSARALPLAAGDLAGHPDLRQRRGRRRRGDRSFGVAAGTTKGVRVCGGDPRRQIGLHADHALDRPFELLALEVGHLDRVADRLHARSPAASLPRRRPRAPRCCRTTRRARAGTACRPA